MTFTLSKVTVFFFFFNGDDDVIVVVVVVIVFFSWSVVPNPVFSDATKKFLEPKILGKYDFNFELYTPVKSFKFNWDHSEKKKIMFRIKKRKKTLNLCIIHYT